MEISRCLLFPKGNEVRMSFNIPDRLKAPGHLVFVELGGWFSLAALGIFCLFPAFVSYKLQR